MGKRLKWLKDVFQRSSQGEGASASKNKAKTGQGPDNHKQDLLDGTSLSTSHLGLRQTLKTAWKMIKPYFADPARRLKSRLMFAGVVALTLGQAGLAYMMNSARGAVWDSFNDNSSGDFVTDMLVFGGVAAGFVALNAGRKYLEGLLQVDWRDWMTDKYQSLWLKNNAFHEVEKKGEGSNPEHKMTQDIIDFCWKTQSLSMSLVNSALYLGMFSQILWEVGGGLALGGVGMDLTIPGYMVGIALAYAAAGTLGMHKVAKPLPTIHNHRQQYEADYRYSLVRIRENTEAIALYRGEEIEKKTLKEKFNKLTNNLKTFVKKDAHVTLFGSSFSTGSQFIPLIAMAPKKFADLVTLGDFTRVAEAFNVVSNSVGWFMTARPELAEYQAVTGRLSKFEQTLQKAGADKGADIKRLPAGDNEQSTNGSHLALNGVSLIRPDDSGLPLFKPFSLDLKAGDRMVLTGVAGSGKSSLLKAVAGMWDHGTGEVVINNNARMLCVPQKPYLPRLPLRGIICYPDNTDRFSDDQVKEALSEAGLGHLDQWLDDESRDGAFWAKRLSGGEQQRLTFARILLHKPDILLLDEVTSSMDPQAEKELYSKIVNKLPDTTMISVAHREKVIGFHTIHANIAQGTLKTKPIPPEQRHRGLRP